MSKLPDSIVLGPEDEARRLWNGARQAQRRAEQDLVALCEFLGLGLRAAEILVVHRLQEVRDRFPATIALQLEMPDPEVDVHRDALTSHHMLPFTDIVDLLSAEELSCVSPGMHRGWEDRVFSCRRSRKTAQEKLGVTLDDADREKLLLLSAYRNRIFRYPPPVRIVPQSLLGAFGALEELTERLFRSP